MWSKQAVDKNPTSPKSKPTNRKQKTDPAAIVDNNSTKAKPAKKNKNRKSRKAAKPDLIEDLHKGDKTITKSDDVSAKNTAVADGRLAKADVMLRGECKNDNNKIHIKRYSDSFVLNDNLPKLTRAASGFILTDNAERKTRRLSDIFRYGTLRTCNSCDNLKMNPKIIEGLDETGLKNDFDEVVLRKKPIDEQKKTKPVKKPASAGDKVKKDTAQPTNNSYLKRVKSKIYKNKTEGVGTAVPTMPDISETVKTKKNKNKKNAEIKEEESRKSFDFRLIRQNSNLERIMPRTFGVKKSSSNTGIAQLDDSVVSVNAEKPILAKSKSSSAINLNLLRTRRNKILEQVKSRNCKVVQDEFDFYAFGSGRNQLSKRFGSQNYVNNNIGEVLKENCKLEDVEGESKPGHPVTRTASDKRPDSVREEASKSQDSPDHSQDKNEDDASHNDSTTSLPATTGNKRKTASNINRSESVKEQSEKEKRKQRRNISDPLHNTTNDRIDLDSQDLDTNSNNSSNSSLCSNKSSESPSNNSTDAVPGSTSAHPTGSECDSDLEVEADFLPDWQCSVPPEELASLHPGEKKRQDVINELFHTERSHVKNLKVLDTVFMRPLVAKQCLKAEELNLVFPNLNELLDIHIKFNNAMKSKKKEGPIIKEVGDVLLNMFDGVMGEHFQRAAATFCERQQLALEFIKEKRRKDSRFETILSDCEKNNLCRRLNLQGIITTQMQRLSKYPLLLERLIDSVEKSLELDMDFWQPELSKLKQAHERSREILNHVNEAAKLAYNCARLEEIQKHLDTSSFERMELSSATEYRNFDLTKYKLIYEGDMILKRPNKGPLQVYILLLEEAVVLLQKEGDKFLLKFFQSGLPGQQPLVPIIRMNNLLFRANAASKSSLYIVNTSSNNIQMYDLQVRDYAERKVWFKHLSDATEAYKVKEGKNKNSDHTHDNEEETVQELPTTSREPTERAEAVGGTDTSLGEASSTATNGEINQRNEVPEEERTKTASSDNDGSAETIGGGVTHSKVTADDWPLIQPSEVQVAVPPVLTAESKLTPLEQIRRKDEEVRQALAAKEGLVADLLSIPREDFLHIADMASEAIHNDNSTERDSTEFVLAPMYQVNQLLEAVNESLNISDSDPVIATGGKTAACASNEIAKSDLVPSVPAHKIRDIVTTLSSQLTTLLSIVKQGDAEREMLRRELHRLREQCHENSLLHGHVVSEVDNSIESTQSGDLEKIEESPTES